MCVSVMTVKRTELVVDNVKFIKKEIQNWFRYYIALPLPVPMFFFQLYF